MYWVNRLFQAGVLFYYVDLIVRSRVACSDSELLFICIMGVIAFACFSHAAATRRKMAARVRKAWPRIGGLALSRLGRGAVILVHWPRPAPSVGMENLAFPIPQDEPEHYLRHVLAHEYAHLLLRTRHRALRLPAWWDEGFAFWFSEQVTGQERWRPESRQCVQDPEPKHDPRRDLDMEPYVRLCARYYWEVRGLMEAGRLPELLQAPVRQLGSFRAELEAPSAEGSAERG